MTVVWERTAGRPEFLSEEGGWHRGAQIAGTKRTNTESRGTIAGCRPEACGAEPKVRGAIAGGQGPIGAGAV